MNDKISVSFLQFIKTDLKKASKILVDENPCIYNKNSYVKSKTNYFIVKQGNLLVFLKFQLPLHFWAKSHIA